MSKYAVIVVDMQTILSPVLLDVNAGALLSPI